MAAVSLQESVATDTAYHLGHVAVGQRGYAKTDVRQHLNVDAAQPKGHERTEEGILRHTSHYLHAVAYHPLIRDHYPLLYRPCCPALRRNYAI